MTTDSRDIDFHILFSKTWRLMKLKLLQVTCIDLHSQWVGIHVMAKKLIYKRYQKPLKQHSASVPVFSWRQSEHLIKTLDCYTTGSRLPWSLGQSHYFPIFCASLLQSIHDKLCLSFWRWFTFLNWFFSPARSDRWVWHRYGLLHRCLESYEPYQRENIQRRSSEHP